MAAWYDDNAQALLETVLGALILIVTTREDYEGCLVRQGRSQKQDTDLPLDLPILSVEIMDVQQMSTTMGDQISPDHQGLDTMAMYLITVSTSRGLPATPRSSSGGMNTANRILGLLMKDINVQVENIPDGVRTWMLENVPAPQGTQTTMAPYDEERDIYRAQGFLFVESEVWADAL